MHIPRRFREQILEFERNGFHVISFEHAKGSHAKVVFAEFPGKQIISANPGCVRNIKNSIARFRKFAAEAKETHDADRMVIQQSQDIPAMSAQVLSHQGAQGHQRA
jgi:hypothetical protein